MNKNRARAYRMEKYYADLFGGLRVGTLGKEDVMHKEFSIECKERQSDSGLKTMLQWFKQAESHAKDKIALLGIHLLGKNYDDDYVVIKLKDFMALITKGE